jgi:hypothetical protein
MDAGRIGGSVRDRCAMVLHTAKKFGSSGRRFQGRGQYFSCHGRGIKY